MTAMLLLAIVWLGVVGHLTSAHPCATAKPSTKVCNPDTNGRTFYFCYTSWMIYEQSCPVGLVFNNKVQNCDWPQNTPPCTTVGKPPATTTTTSSRTTKASVASTTTAPLPTGTCNPITCQLPNCRCVGKDIPGNLAPKDVPQMVLLTFDDGVNTGNFHYYDGLFPADKAKATRNPNGCPTASTFFVSGDWVSMDLVKKLADRGNEIASHSQTHGSPRGWNGQKWYQEIQGMRERLAQDTGLNEAKIVGMRSPYLELGGNDQFSMLQHAGFLYDSTMFGGSLQQDFSDSVIWPFTLKHPPSVDQNICSQYHGCPKRSYQQIWEVPLIRQYSLGGQACSMTDACPFSKNAPKNSIKAFLQQNFDRHYYGNRAPFMISLHATWFDRIDNSYHALVEFLEEISHDPKKEVYQVTITQMLDWVRNPLPLSRLSEIPSWQCPESV